MQTRISLAAHLALSLYLSGAHLREAIATASKRHRVSVAAVRARLAPEGGIIATSGALSKPGTVREGQRR